jgi:hypothetical protein
MKKLSAAVVALLLLVTISACSGSSDSSSSDDYCSLLKKSQDSFGALGFDKLTNDDFDTSRATIDKLQQAASGSIADDWATLGTALDDLKKAVEDAGITMSDIPQLITGNVPQGLDPNEAQALVGKLQQFAANTDLTKAADEIQSDAKKTCNVDLQGTPSS